MSLHTEEVSELARKEMTLGRYLVDKIGGELRGEQGEINSQRLDIEISEVPLTNQEAIKKHIIDFYKSHGFEVKYNKSFSVIFVDENKRKRGTAVSYFEDTGMIRVSAVKISHE